MLRVGTDITALADIEHSLASFGDRFLRRIYTESEIAYCAGSIHRLAARFCAKEALVKAIADPAMATPPTQIEVVMTDGIPGLALHGQIADRVQAFGTSIIKVSISHAQCHACATVVILTSR